MAAAGFVRRRNESFAYPQSVLTQASFLGIGSQGETLSTFEPDKFLKRQQMLGAHEMVQMRAPGFSNPRPAALRAGPMSQRPDTVQTVRAAMVIGGEPFAPGQFGFQRGPGEVTHTITRQIFGQNLEGVARPGQFFERGQDLILATGATPIASGRYASRILNARPITRTTQYGEEEQGFEFAIERSAAPEEALLRSKAFLQKQVGTAMDLTRIEDTQGNPLNVAMMGTLKDYGGYVYSYFMARSPEFLANAVGMPVEQLRRTSFAELGAAPLEAFKRMMVEQNVLQTINVPITTPSGRTRVQQFQALVGDVAVQLSQDNPVRQARLGFDEFQNLRRNDPILAQQLQGTRFNQQMQRTFRNVVSAGLASTGQYELPRGTFDASDPRVVGRISNVLAEAEASARASMPHLGPTEQLPQDVLQHHFAQVWGRRRFFTNVGGTVLPPGSSLQRFAASGAFEGTDVSAYVGSTHRLLSAVVGGDQARIAQETERFREVQLGIAGGRNALRFAQSVFPGNRMVGTVGRGSQSLRPHEVFVPGMGGQAVHVLGFPSLGGQEYRLTFQSLTEQEVTRRGLNPESFYAGIDVVQAMQRDYDGDLFYAIQVGAVQRGQDGKLYAQNGQQLTTADEVRQLARLAVERGAGNLRDEMKGALISYDDALNMVRDGLKPHSISQQRVGELIAEGRTRYGVIGPYYNTFVRGLAGLGNRTQREAMQNLFNISHGFTQRPQALPGDLQTIQDLMRYNLRTGGYRGPESNDPARVGRGPSFNLLRQVGVRALLNARNEDSGNFFLSAEQVTGLVSVGGLNDATARLVEQYRAGGDDTERILRRITQSASLEDFFTGTGLGRMLGGQAVRRALSGDNPLSLSQIANIDRIGMGAATRLQEIGELQASAVLANQKPSEQLLRGLGQTREENMILRAEAARMAQGINLPGRRPVTTAPVSTTRVTPLVAMGPRGTAAAQIPASGPVPVSMGGEAVAAAAAPPMQPPPPDVAVAGAIPEPPGSGGRMTQQEFAQQVPSFMTGQRLAEMRALHGALGSGMQFTGGAIRRGSDPVAFRAAQAAMNVFPMLDIRMSQANAIMTAQGSTSVQREMAEEFLMMAQQIDQDFGGPGGPLENAFRSGVASLVDQPGLTAQQQALGRMVRQNQRDARMGMLVGQQRAGAVGRRAGRRMAASMPGVQMAEQFNVGAAQLQALGGRLTAARAQFEQGGFLTQTRMADEVNQLAQEFSTMKAELKELNPVIKEHREAIGDEIKDLTRRRGEVERRASVARGALETLQTGMVGATDVERAGMMARERQLQRRLGRYSNLAQGIQTQVSALEEARRSMRTAPLAAARAGQVRAPSPFRGALGQMLDPQRMFYMAENLNQLRYSFFQPLIGARQQFLEEQFTGGQLGLNLGLRSNLGAAVGQARAFDAARADAISIFGQGVNEALTPIDELIMGQARGSGSLLRMAGQAAPYVGGALGAGILARGPIMAATRFGASALAGVAGAGTFGSALSLLGGAVTGGIGVGALGYNALRPAGAPAAGQVPGQLAGSYFAGVANLVQAAGIRPEDPAGFNRQLGQRVQDIANTSPLTTFRRLANMPTLLAGEGARQLGFTGISSRLSGLAALGSGDIGFMAGINQVATGQAPVSRESAAGVVSARDIPVTDQESLINRLGAASAEAAGRPAGEFQFSRSELARLSNEYVQATGVSAAMFGGGGSQPLERLIRTAASSGLNADYLLDLMARGPQAMGILPGGQATGDIISRLSEGTTATQITNLMQGFSASSRALRGFGFGIQAEMDIGTRFARTAQGPMGEFGAMRQMSRDFGLTAFDYSRMVEGMGLGNLGIVDELGLPAIRSQVNELSDTMRARNFDFSQRTGQARAGFARQRQDLDVQGIMLGRQRRQDQFEMGQRSADLNIRQMELSLKNMRETVDAQENFMRRSREINKELFELRAGWRLEDLDIQEQRLDTRRAWQVQDFGFRREGFELQAAWQVDDFARAERFATGRQRMDIRRQRRRAEILANRQRSRFAIDEERAAIQYDERRGDIGRQRERTEIELDRARQLRDLQEQMQDTSMRQRAEEVELMEERVAYMRDVRDFQEMDFQRTEEQRQREEEFRMEYTNWQNSTQEAQLQHAQSMFEVQTQIIELQRTQEENVAKFNLAQQIGMKEALGYAQDLIPVYDELVKRSEQIGANLSGGLNTGTPVDDLWDQIKGGMGPVSPNQPN